MKLIVAPKYRNEGAFETRFIDYESLLVFKKSLFDIPYKKQLQKCCILILNYKNSIITFKSNLTQDIRIPLYSENTITPILKGALTTFGL